MSKVLEYIDGGVKFTTTERRIVVSFSGNDSDQSDSVALINVDMASKNIQWLSDQIIGDYLLESQIPGVNARLLNEYDSDCGLLTSDSTNPINRSNLDSVKSIEIHVDYSYLRPQLLDGETFELHFKFYHNTPTYVSYTIIGDDLLMYVPSYNKVIYDGKTLIDLTDTTATAQDVVTGKEFYASNGDKTVGAYTPNNQAKWVTPSKSIQYIYPDSGYDGLNQVTVSPIPSQYVIPTGSETYTVNGTFDVTSLASATINVPSTITGDTKFITGTFTTPSTSGATTLSIPYGGGGYPIIAIVVVDGGVHTSDWYNLLDRYAVGCWCITKYSFELTPTYTTSGNQNAATALVVYKSSSSTATSHSTTGSSSANIFSSNAASQNSTVVCRFTGNKTLSYYVKSTSYGLTPNMTYRYYIYYSA